MTVREFFIENYVMIYEMIGLLALLGITVHVSKRMKRKTWIVVLLLAAENVAFYLERWTQTFEQLSILRPLLTATVYSLYPVILLFVMQITTTHSLTRRAFALLLIPEIVSVVLFFSSQWTRLVFYFHEDNHYSGGPLAWLPYFLFGFYIIVFLVHNMIFFKKDTLKVRLVTAYIALGAAGGVLLYIFLEAERDYSALFTSGILLYFIFLYIHLAKVDPLTGLMNRQCYYTDIASGNRSVTAVVSIDMNGLKILNDTNGHEAGDTALKIVANKMVEYCGNGASVYRVGGDEFMIFYRDVNEETVAEAVGRMKKGMEETDYRCAFGYAMRHPYESVESAIQRSDQMMYREKNRMKGSRDCPDPEGSGNAQDA